jgi:hypothetical protein
LFYARPFSFFGFFAALRHTSILAPDEPVFSICAQLIVGFSAVATDVEGNSRLDGLLVVQIKAVALEFCKRVFKDL